MTPMKKVLSLVLLLSLLQLQTGSTVLAGEKMKGPLKSSSSQQQPFIQTSTSHLVLNGLIQIYSKYISPADGPRSPSYPTGSAYGRQAITKYGFIPGVFLVADRLLHEADTPLGYQISVYGRQRYYDPLEHNTFWWDPQSADKQVEIDSKQ